MQGLGTDTTAVLPPFSRIVIDEAHNVERSATSFFSTSFSRFTILKHAGRLIRERRGKRFGLLLFLETLLGRDADVAQIVKDVAGLREQAEAVTAAAVAATGKEGSVRLLADDESPVLSEMYDALGELQQRLLLTIQHTERLLGDLSDADSERPQMHDLRAVLRRFGEIATACERIRTERDDDSRIFHVEKRQTRRGELYASFVITPLEIGPILCEAVYEPYSTVCFASATLSVGNSFEYWLRRVGLDLVDDERLVEEQFPSPFEYASRVLLAVPTDAPTPDRPNYQEFLSQFVSEALEISEGKALILFTSYRMLEATYAAAAPVLRELGISSFRQGEDDRSRLLQKFNTNIASVLFATDSFWEGVDAPGETLQLVVICRLPFRVPNDPVLVARMDAVRNRGGNPFAELSLPDAVMRLKQGFGRLMRHRDDRGVVLVADSRIVKKQYGRVFLDSLPQTRRSVTDARGVLEELERFLYSPTS
jgi:ATP-dependent DNA helicase DinG